MVISSCPRGSRPETKCRPSSSPTAGAEPKKLIDAENEELFDNRDHSKRVYEILRAKGDVPVQYEIIPGITHYGIYNEAFDQSTDLALEWFNLHLEKR